MARQTRKNILSRTQYDKYSELFVSKIPIALAKYMTTKYVKVLDDANLLNTFINLAESSTIHVEPALIIHSLLLRREGVLHKILERPENLRHIVITEIDKVEHSFPIGVIRSYLEYNISLYRSYMNEKEYSWIKETTWYLLEPLLRSNSVSNIESYIGRVIQSITSILSLVGYRKRIPGLFITGNSIFFLSKDSVLFVSDPATAPILRSLLSTLKEIISSGSYRYYSELSSDIVGKIAEKPLHMAVQLLSYLENSLITNIETLIRTAHSSLHYRFPSFVSPIIKIDYLHGRTLSIDVKGKKFKITYSTSSKTIRQALISLRDATIKALDKDIVINEFGEALIMANYLVKRLAVEIGVPAQAVQPLLPLVINERPKKYSYYTLYTIDVPARFRLEIVDTLLGFGWCVNYLSPPTITALNSPAVSLLRYRDILEGDLKKIIGTIIKTHRLDMLRIDKIGLLSSKVYLYLNTPEQQKIIIYPYKHYQDIVRDIKEEKPLVLIVDAATGASKKIDSRVRLKNNMYYLVVKSKDNTRVYPMFKILKRNVSHEIVAENSIPAVIIEDIAVSLKDAIPKVKI